MGIEQDLGALGDLGAIALTQLDGTDEPAAPAPISAMPTASTAPTLQPTPQPTPSLSPNQFAPPSSEEDNIELDLAPVLDRKPKRGTLHGAGTAPNAIPTVRAAPSASGKHPNAEPKPNPTSNTSACAYNGPSSYPTFSNNTTIYSNRCGIFRPAVPSRCEARRSHSAIVDRADLEGTGP